MVREADNSKQFQHASVLVWFGPILVLGAVSQAIDRMPLVDGGLL